MFVITVNRTPWLKPSKKVTMSFINAKSAGLGTKRKNGQKNAKPGVKSTIAAIWKLLSTHKKTRNSKQQGN